MPRRGGRPKVASDCRNPQLGPVQNLPNFPSASPDERRGGENSNCPDVCSSASGRHQHPRGACDSNREDAEEYPHRLGISATPAALRADLGLLKDAADDTREMVDVERLEQHRHLGFLQEPRVLR